MGSGAISRTVDLRSDTVTKPSPAMRSAMFEAEVGDDVFGDDPTVYLLESKVAEMFGKEKALFFPSGSMSNLAAALSWCGSRGSEAILGDKSHMLLYEQGSIAQFGGINARALFNSPDGTIDVDLVERAIRNPNIHFPITEMIAIENTHNFCGGRILPEGYLKALTALTTEREIPLHLDGARIWNAATASDTPLQELVRGVDSASVCLSKGLGAPAGSLLIGPASFIAKARRTRKALGGGMRQVGVLAAAGLQALSDFDMGLLRADHVRTKRLAKALSEITGFHVDLAAVETNIILVELAPEIDTETLVGLLKERNVLVIPFARNIIRVTVHRDISDKDIDTAIVAFKEVSPRMWIRAQVAAAASASASSIRVPFTVPPATNVSPPHHVTTATATEQQQQQENSAVVTTIGTAVAAAVTHRHSGGRAAEFSAIVPDVTCTDRDRDSITSPTDTISSSFSPSLVIDLPEEMPHSVDSLGETDYSPSCEKNIGVQSILSSALSGVMSNLLGATHSIPSGSHDAAVESFDCKHIRAGDVIVWQGEKGHFFYVVESGRLEVYLMVEGKPLRTGQSLEAGDYFGEIALLYDTRRSATVRAAEDSTLWRLPREAFLAVAEATKRNEQSILAAIEAASGLPVALPSITDRSLSSSSSSSSGSTTTNEPTSEPTKYFEETVIHGMCVSPEGFCVILRGVVCDRFIRVLVTPSDPMADGLDREIPETPEAVTLLQLLQGIDVQTHLPKDTLLIKFAEAAAADPTNPAPGTKQQYILRRVMVDHVNGKKDFAARLCGSLKRSGPDDSASAAGIASSIVDSNSNGGVSTGLPGESPDVFVSPSAAFAQIPRLGSGIHDGDAMAAAATAKLASDFNRFSGSTYVNTGAVIDREVPIKSAFDAVALSLRHHAVIEFSSELLQDENTSYDAEELKQYFPKLLEADISLEEQGRFSSDYDARYEMERLQRRLFEAIRQGNEDKTDAIKRQLEFYSNIEGKSVFVFPRTSMMPSSAPQDVYDDAGEVDNNSSSGSSSDNSSSDALSPDPLA